MFELIIFCVILVAAAYSATLWFMGRREDVLHGEFVHAEQPLPEQPAMRPAPQPPLPPVQPRANPENLQALLEVIKRDLNDAASA